ncbi:MAG: hypothetical protein FWG99_02870 [Treponema sp.]|nr:hypothetical protein [Treponema sp.]
MKRIWLFLILILAQITVFSCSSGPAVEETPGTGTNTMESAPAQEDVVFNPMEVSQDLYVSTIAEVRQFIEELNVIISNKNYNAWRTALSQEFFAEISSAEYLRLVSETDAMKRRRIVLRTPQDYFNNVVVPSRANSRVDDIEFISERRVKAFTVMPNRAGELLRLRLYDLEYADNMWKIIN